uniref:ATP synthase complex subunit 8 n=1 Tax=Aristobrotica sp. REN-2018 TaxID=2506512 RepID=A0A411D9Y3_9CUCU|nr:ATP synthase F0 subunit 8 [Aristobrotica sp. REN-2018]
MPQMMPLNWISLMFFFIFLFYLFNNLNYFNFKYTPKYLKLKKTTLKYIWKW